MAWSFGQAKITTSYPPPAGALITLSHFLYFFSQPEHFQTRPAPPGGGQLLDAQHEGDLQGGRQQGGGGRGGQDQAAGHQPAEEPRRGEQPDDGERETDRGC